MREYAFPPDYCDMQTICYCVSMSETTFRGHMEAGIFPQPVRIGGKVLWPRRDVLRALDELRSREVTLTGHDPIMEAARGPTAKARRHAA